MKSKVIFCPHCDKAILIRFDVRKPRSVDKRVEALKDA
jgi:hypothetical protein